MKNVVLKLGLIISLLFILNSCAQTKAKKVVFPKTCEQSCVTPYGEILGVDKTGVKAYSNCKSSCVVWDPNNVNGVYTGIKWQCVEYARRWLTVNKQLTYGSVDYAFEIWSKIKSFKSTKDESLVPTYNYVNGSLNLPQAGDLLIYSKEFEGTGHVAVVTEVDKNFRWLKVAEENNLNSKWLGNYARKINIVKKEGYWILDKYIIGWKSLIKY